MTSNPLETYFIWKISPQT